MIRSGLVLSFSSDLKNVESFQEPSCKIVAGGLFVYSDSLKREGANKTDKDLILFDFNNLVRLACCDILFRSEYGVFLLVHR